MPRPARAGLKDDLITQAEQLIDEEGLKALTARALATRADCSVGSIYNMFDDLDDLIVTVHGRTLERLGKNASASVDSNRTVEENLLTLASRYIAFIEDNRNLWAAIFEHRLPAGRDIPHWYRERLNDLFAVIESCIEPLLPGERTGARRRQARILWSSIHGICSLGAEGKLNLISDESIAELTSQMIRTYVAGMSALTDPS
jgi:AcrR family transcriptional regulator